MRRATPEDYGWINVYHRPNRRAGTFWVRGDEELWRYGHTKFVHSPSGQVFKGWKQIFEELGPGPGSRAEKWREAGILGNGC